ncbi:hypothetical protein T492DRAFT_146612 [Pavlovales sp. CCMP2436]|nr:hypothetical protein T492DRAFT_146612 [Pavlovales sp. CCMP2436]
MTASGRHGPCKPPPPPTPPPYPHPSHPTPLPSHRTRRVLNASPTFCAPFCGLTTLSLASTSAECFKRLYRGSVSNSRHRRTAQMFPGRSAPGSGAHPQSGETKTTTAKRGSWRQRQQCDKDIGVSSNSTMLFFQCRSAPWSPGRLFGPPHPFQFQIQ